jgi:enoyl-CoA hydratase/carnithine racemase
MPPAKLGLLYSLAGMRRLERAVGEQRARYLLTTAAVIDGARAAQWGLVLEALADAKGLEAAVLGVLHQWRGVNAQSACAAKALLVSAQSELPASLVARAETVRAELFARADLPPKP